MKKPVVILTVCLITLTVIYTSCKKKSTTDDTVIPTDNTAVFYDRAGGTTLVADPVHAGENIESGRLILRSVVDSSILVIAADAQLTPYFAVLFAELGNNNTTGLTALSKNLTDFICVGGGAKNTAYAYTGKNMKDAHDPQKNSRIGLKVNAADFDRFVGDIGIGLSLNGITPQNNQQLINELVAFLYSTKADIVQR